MQRGLAGVPLRHRGNCRTGYTVGLPVHCAVRRFSSKLRVVGPVLQDIASFHQQNIAFLSRTMLNLLLEFPELQGSK